MVVSRSMILAAPLHGSAKFIDGYLGKEAEAPQVDAQDRDLPLPDQAGHGYKGAVAAKDHNHVRIGRDFIDNEPLEVNMPRQMRLDERDEPIPLKPFNQLERHILAARVMDFREDRDIFHETVL
jgi:hypothetical protein